MLRFLRFVSANVALASLLLCCVISWLAWHAHKVQHDRLEVVRFGRYVRISSSEQGIDAFVVRRWAWQGADELRLTSLAEGQEADTYEFYLIGDRQVYASRVEVRSGRYQAYLNSPIEPTEEQSYSAGVMPVRLNHADSATDTILADTTRLSVALPVVTVSGVKHWPFIVLTGILPLLWLAFQFRPKWRLRSVPKPQQGATETTANENDTQVVASDR